MAKRILVIDDDTSILEIMEESLKYMGFEVQTFPTSENIFSIIKEYNPHLILIDYILLGINGGEYCHQIKTNSETSYLPVIIMSALPKVFHSLGRYNCDFFLPKPFNLEDLLKAINFCLETNQVVDHS